MAPPAESPATNTRRGSTARRGRADEVADDRRDRRRLARAAGLVPPLEPVPAALRVLAALLLRVDDDEAVAVGGVVHAGRGREVAASCVQPCSMQTSGPATPGSPSAGCVDQRAARPSGRDGRLCWADEAGRPCARSITARFDA